MKAQEMKAADGNLHAVARALLCRADVLCVAKIATPTDRSQAS